MYLFALLTLFYRDLASRAGSFFPALLTRFILTKHDSELSFLFCREILGDLAQETEYTMLKNSLRSNFRVEPIPTTKPLFGLEVVGHGINWWDGSFTAEPLIDLCSNLKNTYYFPSSNELFNIPDEFLITNTPIISRDGEVSYQENYNEFASMRSNKFGLGIGFGGFSTRFTQFDSFICIS
jgi:hypothetical protein